MDVTSATRKHRVEMCCKMDIKPAAQCLQACMCTIST